MKLLPERGTTWDPRRIYAERGAIAGKRVGRVLCARYRRKLEAGRLPAITPARKLELDMLSFSCERDVPEQALSIRSLLRYVGEPVSFAIVSDGTITPRSAALLEAISPVVRVVSVAEYAEGVEVPAPVYAYRDKPHGKKLTALLGMRPAGRPVCYADSDVLFHVGGHGFAELVDRVGDGAYYLQDCQPALDVRLVPPEERFPPVNSGFLLTGRPIDWSDAIDRLGKIGEADAPGYGWTEQSTVHLAYHAAGAQPLPRESCVVEINDRHTWADQHVGESTWLRHYVTGTRFKMWLCLLGAVQP